MPPDDGKGYLFSTRLTSKGKLFKLMKALAFLVDIHAPQWAMRHLYGDIIMGAMASQITNLTIIYSTVYSGADQRKHQSSASLAFVRGIHRWPVNSPHKWPVTRKMFPFDDVIMETDFFKASFSILMIIRHTIWWHVQNSKCLLQRKWIFFD